MDALQEEMQELMQRTQLSEDAKNLAQNKISKRENKSRKATSVPETYNTISTNTESKNSDSDIIEPDNKNSSDMGDINRSLYQGFQGQKNRDFLQNQLAEEQVQWLRKIYMELVSQNSKITPNILEKKPQIAGQIDTAAKKERTRADGNALSNLVGGTVGLFGDIISTVFSVVAGKKVLDFLGRKSGTNSRVNGPASGSKKGIFSRIGGLVTSGLGTLATGALSTIPFLGGDDNKRVTGNPNSPKSGFVGRLGGKLAALTGLAGIGATVFDYFSSNTNSNLNGSVTSANTANNINNPIKNNSLNNVISQNTPYVMSSANTANMIENRLSPNTFAGNSINQNTKYTPINQNTKYTPIGFSNSNIQTNIPQSNNVLNTAQNSSVRVSPAMRLASGGLNAALSIGALAPVILDENLKAEDKATEISKTAGGVAGAMGGAALGASIGSVVPVIGTAVGGLIGSGVGYLAGSGATEVIKDTISNTVETLGVGDMIGRAVALPMAAFSDDARDALVQDFKNLVPSIKESFIGKIGGTIVNGVSSLSSSVGDFFSSIFGDDEDKTNISTDNSGISNSTDNKNNNVNVTNIYAGGGRSKKAKSQTPKMTQPKVTNTTENNKNVELANVSNGNVTNLESANDSSFFEIGGSRVDMKTQPANQVIDNTKYNSMSTYHTPNESISRDKYTSVKQVDIQPKIQKSKNTNTRAEAKSNNIRRVSHTSVEKPKLNDTPISPMDDGLPVFNSGYI